MGQAPILGHGGGDTPSRGLGAVPEGPGILTGCAGREEEGTFGSRIFVIFLFNSSCSSSSSSVISSS